MSSQTHDGSSGPKRNDPSSARSTAKQTSMTRASSAAPSASGSPASLDSRRAAAAVDDVEDGRRVGGVEPERTGLARLREQAEQFRQCERFQRSLQHRSPRWTRILFVHRPRRPSRLERVRSEADAVQAGRTGARAPARPRPASPRPARPGRSSARSGARPGARASRGRRPPPRPGRGAPAAAAVSSGWYTRSATTWPACSASTRERAIRRRAGRPPCRRASRSRPRSRPRRGIRPLGPRHASRRPRASAATAAASASGALTTTRAPDTAERQRDGACRAPAPSTTTDAPAGS